MLEQKLEELTAAVLRLAEAVEARAAEPVKAVEPAPAKVAEPVPAEPVKAVEPAPAKAEVEVTEAEPVEEQMSCSEFFQKLRELLAKVGDKRAAQEQVLKNVGCATFKDLPPAMYAKVVAEMTKVVGA